MMTNSLKKCMKYTLTHARCPAVDHAGGMLFTILKMAASL